MLLKEDVWSAVTRLREILYFQYKSLSKDEWTAYVKNLQEDQAITEYLYRCPYTKRAKDKPKGYAGDAVMMDYIYGLYDNDLLKKTDGLGEEVFRFTTNSSAARAVRYRRRVIAKYLDATYKKNSASNILSLACGHLREFELSTIGDTAYSGKYVALDQDKESIKTISDEYSSFGVTPIKGSVKCILTNKFIVEDFDFVYSAGLYDYLSDAVAKDLTALLVSGLNKNGRIIIANFLPEHDDIGYMEAIMDWILIYRTTDQLKKLLSSSGCKIIDSYNDPSNSIAFVVGEKL